MHNGHDWVHMGCSIQRDYLYWTCSLCGSKMAVYKGAPSPDRTCPFPQGGPLLTCEEIVRQKRELGVQVQDA